MGKKLEALVAEAMNDALNEFAGEIVERRVGKDEVEAYAVKWLEERRKCDTVSS